MVEAKCTQHNCHPSECFQIHYPNAYKNPREMFPPPKVYPYKEKKNEKTNGSGTVHAIHGLFDA